MLNLKVIIIVIKKIRYTHLTSWYIHVAANHNHLITMSTDYCLIWSGYTSILWSIFVLLSSLFHQVFYKEIKDLSVMTELIFMTYMYLTLNKSTPQNILANKLKLPVCVQCLFVCLAFFWVKLIFSILLFSYIGK